MICQIAAPGKYFLAFIDLFFTQVNCLNEHYFNFITNTGAALGLVPWVPVNPWISRTFAS